MVKERTNFLKLKNKYKIYLNDLYCKNIKYKFYLNKILISYMRLYRKKNKIIFDDIIFVD